MKRRPDLLALGLGSLPERPLARPVWSMAMETPFFSTFAHKKALSFTGCKAARSSTLKTGIVTRV